MDIVPRFHRQAAAIYLRDQVRKSICKKNLRHFRHNMLSQRFSPYNNLTKSSSTP